MNLILFVNENVRYFGKGGGRARESKVDEQKKRKKRKRELGVLPDQTAPLKQLFGGNRELVANTYDESFEVRSDSVEGFVERAASFAQKHTALSLVVSPGTFRSDYYLARETRAT